jgi:hypothetical protein
MRKEKGHGHKLAIHRDDPESPETVPRFSRLKRNERKKIKVHSHMHASSLLDTRDYVKARATRVRRESRSSPSLGKMCRVLQRAHTYTDDSLDIFSFSRSPRDLVFLPSRPGVSVHRANPVLICPRARDTRRAENHQGEGGIRRFRARNAEFSDRQASTRKRHCPPIARVLHSTPRSHNRVAIVISPYIVARNGSLHFEFSILAEHASFDLFEFELLRMTEKENSLVSLKMISDIDAKPTDVEAHYLELKLSEITEFKFWRTPFNP